MLAQAESRLRFKAARRRRLVLLGPTTFAIFWALADLVAARHARLTELHAGFLRHAVDHGEVIGWTLLFVLAPIALAIKPEPLTSGAALSLAAGPILSPILFGSGGWKWWQVLLVALVDLLILAAARTRARRTRPT